MPTWQEQVVRMNPHMFDQTPRKKGAPQDECVRAQLQRPSPEELRVARRLEGWQLAFRNARAPSPA